MTIFYLSIKGEAHCYVPSMKGNQDTLSGGLRVSPPTAWLRRDWRVCPGTPASNTVWSGNSPECLLCVRPLLGMGRGQESGRSSQFLEFLFSLGLSFLICPLLFYQVAHPPAPLFLFSSQTPPQAEDGRDPHRKETCRN